MESQTFEGMKSEWFELKWVCNIDGTFVHKALLDSWGLDKERDDSGE